MIKTQEEMNQELMEQAKEIERDLKKLQVLVNLFEELSQNLNTNELDN